MSETIVAKNGGTVLSKNAIYNKIAVKEEKILQTLFNLLDSKNESVQMGAAKVLINKIVPDLKAMEIEGGVNNIKILVMPSDMMAKHGIPSNTEISSEESGQIQSS